MALEPDAVSVEFFVAQLPWTTGSKLIHDFRQAFVNFAPVFVETRDAEDFTLEKSREQDGSYGRIFLRDNTTLRLRTQLFNRGYSITIRTTVKDFNDHFEVFTTDVAKTLFPPIEAPRAKKALDLESWRKEFGRSFEDMGCRVGRESNLSWKDLTGLAPLRERLERSVFQPLAREPLYRKIADRVMPGGAQVLPRGVLLYGPPGCGKTWSMRVIAGEAGLPVVVLPCDAVLTKWYGESEQRLAGVFRLCHRAGRMILLIDELDALARHRGESHETTARMVSILLSEMDGLAEAADVLVVGSVNDVASIDRAVLDRFDLRIEFGLPTRDQLQAALSYYARQLSEEDVEEVAAHLNDWNFRRVARFAEEVLRSYVSGLDLTQLEANEPPVPRKGDYLRTLTLAPPPSG